MLESRDGGRTWTLRAEAGHGHLGFDGYARGIAFAADGHGLLWYYKGVEHLTADGGRHWRLRGAVPGLEQSDLDFFASASVEGRTSFGLIWRNAYGQGPRRGFSLVRSDDGGAHWRVVRRLR